MTVPDFQRARSSAAKQLRESAILEAARVLGAERGIRQITLTEIAEAVGMHKSALLRYFETREEIFLRLTADGWRDEGRRPRLRTELGEASGLDRLPAASGGRFRQDARGPRVVLRPAGAVGRRSTWSGTSPWKRSAPLSSSPSPRWTRSWRWSGGCCRGYDRAGRLSTSSRPATAMAGAFWQMATPRPEAAALYRSDPRLAHAVSRRLSRRVARAAAHGHTGGDAPLVRLGEAGVLHVRRVDGEDHHDLAAAWQQASYHLFASRYGRGMVLQLPV